MPKKEFSSRFADPNHPVNKGGPLCVLTGGAISKDNKKRERKEREAKEDIAAGRTPKSSGGGFKKKLLSEVCSSGPRSFGYMLTTYFPPERSIPHDCQYAHKRTASCCSGSREMDDTSPGQALRDEHRLGETEMMER